MKIKNLLVIPTIALAVSTIVPNTANAEFFYDEFYVSTEVNDYIFDDFANVSVYQGPEASMVDVVVTINSIYSPNQISDITGYDMGSTYSNLLGLWYSDQNGVIYNPNECYVVSFCYTYDNYGNDKFMYNNEDYNGLNKTYWTANFSELEAGDSFGFEVILYDGVDNTDVQIFGKNYTISAPEYTDAPSYAPESTYTQNSVESEIPQTTKATTVTTTTKPVTTTTTSNFIKRTPPTITPIPYETIPITTTTETTTTTIETTTTTTTTIPVTTKKYTTITKPTTNTTIETTTKSTEITELYSKEEPNIIVAAFKFIGCTILAAIGIIAKKFL